MVTSTIQYLGDKRTEATHSRSRRTIVTDAPLDNDGRGEAFSPTDLLSTSLACCMFTLMGITANKHGFKFHGGEASLEKIMESNPRRVGRIEIAFKLVGVYTSKQQNMLETAAINCPVAKSLNPELEQRVAFAYGNL
ncbi:MAG: OsmC family protein [Flavobacteriales bacterium]